MPISVMYTRRFIKAYERAHKHVQTQCVNVYDNDMLAGMGMQLAKEEQERRAAALKEEEERNRRYSLDAILDLDHRNKTRGTIQS
jgi:mRNA-degrading endonuclease RelE of RelBE toxin-antitoxin system